MIDYDEYDRPIEKKGRAEAFFDVLKRKYKYLFLLGVMFAFSAAPMITFRYLTVVHEVEMNAAVAAGEVSAHDALLSVNSLQNLYYAVSIALVLLIALVVSGAGKALKCLSWNEPTPFRENTGEGIKENILYYGLCFILNVLLLWGNNFVRNSNPEFSFWYYIPTAGWYLIALPISLWFCSCTAVYKDNPFKTFAVALKLYGKTMPMTLLMTLIIAAPLALMLIPVAWIQLAVPFAYAMFYAPIALLAWAYYTNSVFDKYINATSFPDLVDKGLY